MTAEVTTDVTSEAPGVPGTYAPDPGGAPVARMIVAQAALETRMLLRNGEQLLLTVIIPSLLLVLFSTVDIVTVPVPATGAAAGPSTSSRPASSLSP